MDGRASKHPPALHAGAGSAIWIPAIPADMTYLSVRLKNLAYHNLMIYRICIETSVVSMRGLCAAKGYKLPELVTPFELMKVLS